MKRLTGLFAGTVVIVLVAGAWGPTASQATSPAPQGSLAELTAEVRQLRLSIEGASRGQTQVQALGIQLSAEQSRLTQVASRLDGFADQLNKAAERTQKIVKDMADAQKKLPGTTGIDRIGTENEIKNLKAEYDPAIEEENAIRLRYNEALAAFRTEEARWLELVAKLEEIIKR